MKAIEIFLIAVSIVLVVGMICYAVYISKEKRRLLSSNRARAEALARFKKYFDKEVVEIEKKYQKKEISKKAIKFSEAQNVIVRIQAPQEK